MKSDFRPLLSAAPLLVALAGTASADIRVPGDQPTVQAAIDAAVLLDGDTIILAPGIYRESLVIPEGPLAIEIRSETPGDDGVVTQTILSGDLDGDGAGDARILRVDGDAGAMLTLRGLTFADGAVVNSEIGDDPDAQPIGGAVRMDDGTLAIESCIFLRNRVDGAEESRGGAVAFANGALTIEASRFEGNERNPDDGSFGFEYGGAGVFSLNASVQITGSSFLRNRANIAPAIHINQGSASLDSCSVVSNEVLASGSVFLLNCSADVSQCEFRDNTGSGSGLSSSSISDTLIRVSETDFIENNGQLARVGPLDLIGGNFELVDCRITGTRFSNSRAPGNCGTVIGGSVRIEKLAVLGNRNTLNLDVRASDRASYVSNSVFIGSGIDAWTREIGGDFPLPVIGCTFFDRLDTSPVDDTNGAFVSCLSNYQLIGVDAGNPIPGSTAFCAYPSADPTTYQTGPGNIDAVPQFLRNPNDGGDGWGDDPTTPDLDESANDDYGDLRLIPGSPAIDAGDSTAIPADAFDLDSDGDTDEPVPFDIAGTPRRLDDPQTTDTGVGPAPVVDMGAYEFDGTCSIADLAPPKGLYDLADIGAFVSGFVTGDTAVDFAAPFGALDLGDIVAFVEAYTAGCP